MKYEHDEMVRKNEERKATLLADIEKAKSKRPKVVMTEAQRRGMVRARAQAATANPSTAEEREELAKRCDVDDKICGPLSRRSVGVAINSAVNRAEARVHGQMLDLLECIEDLQREVAHLKWGKPT